MKRTFTLFLALVAASFVWIACTKTQEIPKTADANKTAPNIVLENLITAFQGESNASHKYMLFADAADKEGYKEVAVLFRAASKAESVHAANHLKVIQQMGGTATPDIKSVEIKTTKENLQAAIDGETYEFTTMYPEFIAMAKKERNMDAIKTFNYAMEVEKGHAGLYTDAMNNLEKMKQMTHSYWVCPVCGETFAAKQSAPCPICATPNEKFMEIK